MKGGVWNFLKIFEAGQGKMEKIGKKFPKREIMI